MEYYAKQVDESGAVVALHSMSRPFTETTAFLPIDEAEYQRLLLEMEAGA